ncbi:MAG: ORF6N domain-containing protein [Nitrospirae bacterium]|nr:ORF6N domain-containing protein [Nitrospirota bacterium]
MNQAVRRNIDRFPDDFMFTLTREEIMRISQIVISSGHETLKFAKSAMVFTEQGVAMLSSVLNSKRAVQVNIAIMRVFVNLREMIASNKELAKRLDELEKKYDAQFKVVFEAIRQLMTPPEPKKKKIGFVVRERTAQYKTHSRKAVKK